MHVGLVIDEERLLHEHVVLNRLVIGLVDLGAQVTRFVPEGGDMERLEEIERRVALVAQRIEVPMRVPYWMRRARARQLAASMERSIPDVLYAVGAGAWPVALQLGLVLDRPVALEVWAASLVRQAPHGRTAAPVAAYVAPTEPLAEALRERVDPELVTMIRTGVAIPRDPQPVLADPEQSIGLAIIGAGRDSPSYGAMLAGLSRVVRDMPQVQAVIELRGPRSHGIWREARRLELLGNLTAIRDAAPLRSLLTECDLLVMPERSGEMRSLTLEAMANRRAVIAAEDDSMDMLVDGETAAIVGEATAESWRRAMRRVLSDPDRARALGDGARRRVEAEHRSSEQVGRLLSLLERLMSGGAYSFAHARADG